MQLSASRQRHSVSSKSYKVDQSVITKPALNVNRLVMVLKKEWLRINATTECQTAYDSGCNTNCIPEAEQEEISEVA